MTLEYLKTDYSHFIFTSRYARWVEKENRRETWTETVKRYFDFMETHLKEECNYKLKKSLRNELEQSVLRLDVLPSMRCLATAGPALDRCNVAGYNCSYLPIESPRCFDELFYILLCGTGVGYSVERQYTNQLPSVSEHFEKSSTVITVDDSKSGWARSLKELIALLYQGQIPSWDVSKVRPKGARLKTFGGRASGPGPLVELFKYTVNLFQGAAGRKLNSIECHDLCCKIAAAVVVGGVRRCLPASAPVFTTRGVVPISQVAVGDYVTTNQGEFRVLAAECTGTKKTLVIKHQFGELECTPEHQVAVFTSLGVYGFKAAGDVAKGDRLVWDSRGIDGVRTNLPVLVNSDHFNAKTLTQPTMTDDFAWLLGLVHGDGCVTEKGLEISCFSGHPQILDKAAKVLQESFGVGSAIGPDSKGGNCIRLRCNSTAISGWFSTIKQSNSPLVVPDFIANSTRGVRAAYLAGLFDADGRTRRDNVCDQVTTVYSSFATQIRTVLASLGIGSSVLYSSAEKRREAGVQAKDHATVKVTGKTNKRKWLDALTQHSVSGKLAGVEMKHSKSDFSYPASWFSPQRQGYKKHGNVSVDALDLEYSYYLPTSVTLVTAGRDILTYDIEVETAHQFTTDGVVVHNSAMISLSNLSDPRMRDAKTGEWFRLHPDRSFANNSVVYTEKPDMGIFVSEWKSLYDSHSGERGIFNRVASQKQAALNGRRDNTFDFGTNPCSEIILRPYQFCNLTEVVVREGDTVDALKNKVRLASILGTFQSTLTNFKYLRKVWQKNTEEERLLGVSLTGICDNPLMYRNEDGALDGRLSLLKDVAIQTNKEFADELDIPVSAAITCVKPSGTVSQLVNAASGIHPRHSVYYVRRVRGDSSDPLATFLKDQGVPTEPCAYKPDSTVIFSFPIAGSSEALTRHKLDALQQLQLWKTYQEAWCEHKPSITVYVKDAEWMEVGAWVYKHFDAISGISFLPYDGGTYVQAPYTEITETEYKELAAAMPKNIDWGRLKEYEKEDGTMASQEFACAGGVCEIVDLKEK